MQKINVAFNAKDSLDINGQVEFESLQGKLYVALQTSMDMYTLLNIFKMYAQEKIHFDSLSLANVNEKVDIQIGETQKHTSTFLIETQGQNIGALNFSRQEPFSDQEQKLLSVLIKPLAFPLRHALEYKRAVHTSLTDALTGVGNRAAMELAMEAAWVTAQRYNQDFSILLIDLDHFKQVNDQYGHLAGDKVLKTVATMIKQTIRGADQVFRFGGEEFLVILPNTDVLGGFIIGERIRSQIGGIDCLCNREFIRVTTSVGLASMQDGESYQAILDRCDRALYRAKSSGRNCVCSG